jgi:hypothetical protein
MPCPRWVGILDWKRNDCTTILYKLHVEIDNNIWIEYNKIQ